MENEKPPIIRRGTCISYDDKGREVAWLAVDETGLGIPYNDEAALYCLTSIQQFTEDAKKRKEEMR